MMISIVSLSSAMNYTIHGNNSKTLNAIMASGTIELDDIKKLDKFISKLPKKKHMAIYFDSPGGSLYGGIKLGKYFKYNRIKTVIEKDTICASACAFSHHLP